MRASITSAAALLLIAVVHMTPAYCGDHALAWPQFRGPAGSGVADDQQPPTELGPDKNVKWKVAAPSGFSSPIIAGDTLVITAFENEKLYTIAYNRADGSEAWRAEAPAKQLEKYHKTEGSPAASTCATDGEHIVAYFGSCGLFCYDLSGKELWKLGMPPAVVPGGFGSGVSPIIADGLVILLRDTTDDAKIMAVDVATGDIKWEQKRESQVGYCTPAVWDTPDGKQLAAPGTAQMTGYDLQTGAQKWFVVGMPAGVCASPVTADGNLYFAAWSPGGADDDSGFKMPTFDDLLKQMSDDDKDGALSRAETQGTDFENFFDGNDSNNDGKIQRTEWEAMLSYLASAKNSAFALKPGGSGDVTKTHIAWQKTKGLPYVPTALVYRGQHIMLRDGGIVTAYDAKTGEEIYQKRALPNGSYYASPVAANGNIYFVSLADGAVTVVKAGGKAPEVVAKNPPLEERVDATPAIADDSIYIRTAGHLYAFADNDE